MNNTNQVIADVLAGIQAAVAAAPGIADVVEKAKGLIDALFTAKVVTAEQQNALKAHVDSLAALAAAGVVPPHWQVEPDPVDPVNTVKLG